MSTPAYTVRGAFQSPDWTEISSKFNSWDQLGTSFNGWEELSAGEVPANDVLGLNIVRRASSFTERLEIGQGSVALDNNGGDYSPEDVAALVPHGVLLAKAIEPFEPVTFPGSAYLLRGADLDGNADGQKGCLSGWFNMNSDFDGDLMRVVESAGTRFVLERLATNALRLLIRDGSGNVKVNLFANGFSSAKGVFHLYAYWDTTIGSGAFFVDGAQTGAHSVTSGPTLDYTRTNWAIGSTTAGADILGADMADLYINLSTYLDPTSASNLEKFRDAGGGRVWLGANGQLPTGGAPHIFLHGRPSTFHTNLGSGGGFTLSGVNSLTAGVSSMGGYYANHVHGLFSGLINNISVSPDLGRRRTTLTADDRSTFFRRVINDVVRGDTKVASLAIDVMSLSGIEPGYRQLAITSDDEIDFSFFDQEPAGDAFTNTINAGFHRAYVGGDGKISVKDRNFDIGLSAIYSYNAFFGLSYGKGLDGLINDARILSEPRKLATSVDTLAWIENPIAINAGGSAQFFLEYLDPVNLEGNTPATSLETPVSSSDFLLFQNEDGTGTNLTSAAAVEISFFARSALVSITNSDASQVSYLTKFQIRGSAFQRQPSFIAQAEIGSSQAAYGRQSFVLRNDLITSQPRAQDFTIFTVQRRQDPLPQMSFALKNQFPDVVDLDLLDKVHLDEQNTGIANDVLINSVEHSINLDRGLEHEVRYGVEKADAKEFLILDKDPEGKLDIRRLGF